MGMAMGVRGCHQVVFVGGVLRRLSPPGFLRPTLGTRGFSRVRREFSVFGRRPTHLRPQAEATSGEAARKTFRAFRAGHYKDLTETGNRARNVSGTQGISGPNLLSFLPIYSGTGLSLFWGLSIQETLSFRRVSNSQWGGGFYGYRQKFWLFYGYRLIFFNYG